MAIHGTSATKAAAFKPYPNPDINNGKGEGFSTCDAAPKPNTIKGRISGALALYTKVQYIGLSKRLGWVPFFYIKRRGKYSLVHVLLEEIFYKQDYAIRKTDPNAKYSICAQETKFVNSYRGLIKYIKSHFLKNVGYIIRSVKPGGQKELELDNLTTWRTLYRAIRNKEELDIICPISKAFSHLERSL